MDTDSRQLARGLVDDGMPTEDLGEKQPINFVLDMASSAAAGTPKGFFAGLKEEKKEVAKPPETPCLPAFLRLSYYREYFELSTEVAIRRTLKAAWPFGPDSFVETEHKADLYVPLWTFITLIISMSTFGNIVHGVKTANSSSSATRLKVNFDASKVTTTAMVLFFYVVINPAMFYVLLRYKGASIAMIDLLCLYGYSYVPFVPMSLLFAMQFPVFQVVVLFGASGLSMYFLYRNLGEICQKYLGDLMYYAKPYMVILQIVLVCLIYFKIYA